MTYHRKVIQITAEDSPNVKYALLQRSLGISPDNEIVCPGVLTYEEYKVRRKLWDQIRQCISLDARFYKGSELLLYPPHWLVNARELDRGLLGKKRIALAIGIDPAEGGDKTAMSAVDEYGLIELVSQKTPDTSDITDLAIAFMKRHNVHPERVYFDRGGGGKQHADRLRKMGYDVNTVAFGESVMMDPKRGLRLIEERIGNREERYSYFNRRAKMYGELSELLDPSYGGFALPEEYSELFQQMAPIPKTYREGRLYILPKSKKDAGSKEKTLTELIGHSPDELDSLVIALHAMNHSELRITAGAV